MAAEMQGTVAVSDTTTLSFKRPAEGLFLIVGQWYVEVSGGYLIVRAKDSALNDSGSIMLKVEA